MGGTDGSLKCPGAVLPCGAMDDFQDRGAPHRQRLGIDGTAGDAQDVPHGFVADEPHTWCVVCGLAEAAKVHR